MKMIRTISIATLCLAATLLGSVQFVPGELSLSQASDTYGGGGDCVDYGSKACPSSCGVQEAYRVCKSAECGFETCYTSGSDACGVCAKPNVANLCGTCPE